MLLCGCSGEYKHSSDGLDQQRQQVSGMIAELRKAGADVAAVVASQAAPELDDAGRQALVLSMQEVSKALAADVTAIDRFGENVYRVSIHVRTAQGEADRCFLLVARDDRLYWAGRN